MTVPTWKVIIIVLFLVLITVFISLNMRLYYERNICATNSSPYCYKDYVCESLCASNPSEAFPLCNIQNLIQNGCAIQEDGTVNPATCPNAWPVVNCQICNPGDNCGDCPKCTTMPVTTST